MEKILDFNAIVKKGDFNGVYRPNDDSFFLLDSIMKDID